MISIVALLISVKQLRWTITEQGNRSLRMFDIRSETPPPPDISKRLGEHISSYSLITIRMKVVGPATLYEVHGYAWDDSPSSFNFESHEDKPSINVDHGPGEVPILISHDIINDCYVGVNWMESDGYSLKERTIRCRYSHPFSSWEWEMLRRPSSLRRVLTLGHAKEKWVSLTMDNRGYLTLPRP